MVDLMKVVIFVGSVVGGIIRLVVLGWSIGSLSGKF